MPAPRGAHTRPIAQPGTFQPLDLCYPQADVFLSLPILNPEPLRTSPSNGSEGGEILVTLPLPDPEPRSSRTHLRALPDPPCPPHSGVQPDAAACPSPASLPERPLRRNPPLPLSGPRPLWLAPWNDGRSTWSRERPAAHGTPIHSITDTSPLTPYARFRPSGGPMNPIYRNQGNPSCCRYRRCDRCWSSGGSVLGDKQPSALAPRGANALSHRHSLATRGTACPRNCPTSGYRASMSSLTLRRWVAPRNWGGAVPVPVSNQRCYELAKLASHIVRHRQRPRSLGGA